MIPKWRSRYSGPNRSGICQCSHHWEDHHGAMVMNADYAAATGESHVPGACEFYGCNEAEGLDDKGQPHCFQYRDTGELESPAERAHDASCPSGTARSAAER